MVHSLSLLLIGAFIADCLWSMMVLALFLLLNDAFIADGP